ncbi:acyl-CoA thioesterase [Fulvivirgaceae bacterium PWU4]|uniref:Acyl-CoA thioesterase n=1 Tax=Chryseosolibacter histidini TaxID=2782349 RepID=A0AAP2DR58_9BACT|nr:acyl-CoA thioesterase [Chryseosolibacter histidini]MBT1699722.1 acyl-CoA thioesterase [Chryseosolibacter histidini]
MLSDKTEVTVRFNEADPLGIVWHGHYVRYFEDGREAFGKRFGISYLDFYHQGIAVPVVSVQCDYKKPLRYGDSVIVETKFINSAAAKLKFEYRMFESESKALVATGSSLQVFVDAKTFELQLTMPSFFEAWKKKWDLR